ncbi:MAG: hypothetical protein ACYCT1_02920 [Steroidobacteraceae bacterium]
MSDRTGLGASVLALLFTQAKQSGRLADLPKSVNNDNENNYLKDLEHALGFSPNVLTIASNNTRHASPWKRTRAGFLLPGGRA